MDQFYTNTPTSVEDPDLIENLPSGSKPLRSRNRTGKASRQKHIDSYRHKIGTKIANEYQIKLLRQFFPDDEIDFETARLKTPSQSSVAVIENVQEVEVSNIALHPIAEALVSIVQDKEDDLPVETVASVYNVLDDAVTCVLDQNEFHDDVALPDQFSSNVLEIPSMFGFYINAFNGYVDERGNGYSPVLSARSVEIDEPMADVTSVDDIDSSLTVVSIEDSDDSFQLIEINKAADTESLELVKIQTHKDGQLQRLFTKCTCDDEVLDLYVEGMEKVSRICSSPGQALEYLSKIKQTRPKDMAVYESVIKKYRELGYQTDRYQFSFSPNIRGGNDAIKWIQRIHGTYMSLSIEPGFNEACPTDIGSQLLLRPISADYLCVGKQSIPKVGFYRTLLATKLP